MAYNIVVVVREVWDTRDLLAAPLDESGKIKGDALDTRFEPEDLNALEMALRIKDENDATVTAVSIGAPGGVDVLRESMYRGVDNVLRIEADPRGSDTQAQAALLASAIKGLGDVHLVLTGTTIPDGQNAALGPQLAEALGIDSLNWVDGLEGIASDAVKAKRAIEMGYETVELPFPALLSVGVALLEDDPRSPRNAKAMLKLKKKKEPIESMAAAELGLADPAAAATTRLAAFEAVAQRVVESKEVDTEDEGALQSMLNEVLKGE
jgi:electron transfer flavoprotein beta subunit